MTAKPITVQWVADHPTAAFLEIDRQAGSIRVLEDALRVAMEHNVNQRRMDLVTEQYVRDVLGTAAKTDEGHT